MTLRNELERILITSAGSQVATAFRHVVVGYQYRLLLAERDNGLLNDVHPDDKVISFNIAKLAACYTS